MKMTLTVVADEPGDNLELLRMQKATSAYLVIHEMFEELRKEWKYSQDEEATKAAHRYRDILNMLCERHNINLDSELE